MNYYGSNGLLLIKQALTEKQKKQVKENLGIKEPAQGMVIKLTVTPGTAEGEYTVSCNAAIKDIATAIRNATPIAEEFYMGDTVSMASHGDAVWYPAENKVMIHPYGQDGEFTGTIVDGVDVWEVTFE